MQTRFLLGPAGSGKTYRCLGEIRAQLEAEPDGPPLLFIAPKQATFQLERQLLSDGSIGGYTRLHILSFERLALFVLESLGAPVPSLLDEEGRLMVLRALLARRQSELKVFHANARMQGFARQASLILREFQQHDIDAARLRTLAEKFGDNVTLGRKLHDLSIALEAYGDWLDEHGLSDADSLFDAAIKAVRKHRQSPTADSDFRFGGIWMDGFGELPPKQLSLLTALLPAADNATLAFCLDDDSPEERSWHSPWSPIYHAFQRCLSETEETHDAKPEVQILSRTLKKSRFERSPTLQHLERRWAGPSKPDASPRGDQTDTSVRVVRCATPEAEAVFAARAIRRFVREEGARYRDCAVIVRSLELYHHTIRRVFRRFDIPFFLDRREPVGHHPLAELTRAAIRLVAFNWRHDDWFSALKSGLASPDEFAVDQLENEALARGWEGEFWHSPITLADDAILAERLEETRAEIVPPFARFRDFLTKTDAPPTGPQLAAALRRLWTDLDVESKLEKWNADIESPIHQTVWEELEKWLGNVERAFPREPIPLREWLPILETGLGNLSVGVIPPALDQVLIGAIDRSRNPELKLAFVLGANEGVFPAVPETTGLLSDHERERLESAGAQLGPSRLRQISLERYYGYIAFTRPRERLVVTYAQRSLEDTELNPSPFIHRLRRIFPELEIETPDSALDWSESEHIGELVAPLMRQLELPTEARDPGLERIANLPAVLALGDQITPAREPSADESIAPQLAGRLYGPTLRASVSRIEHFAACPFRFFANSGMRAEERRVFQIDSRERGTFQHEVLSNFHDELQKEGKRWRDLSPPEAGERVRRLADQFADNYRDGLFRASEKNLFAVESLSRDLQEFIEVVIAWMEDYGFDPTEVELGFGDDSGRMPAWELDLGDGHRMAFNGKIDRIDLDIDPATGEADCVVIDYKSSARKIDLTLLQNGIQIQLPAYLAALAQAPNPESIFDLPVTRLNPLGVFYINLRGQFSSAPARDEAIENLESDRRQAYQHVGRYSLEAQPKLDRKFARDGKPSGQFPNQLKKDGSPRKDSTTVMEAEPFRDLLHQVEAKLTEMGRDIFAGQTAVDPFRHKTKSGCDYCDYRSVCRIDPWSHPFRILESEPTPS